MADEDRDGGGGRRGGWRLTERGGGDSARENTKPWGGVRGELKALNNSDEGDYTYEGIVSGRRLKNLVQILWP